MSDSEIQPKWILTAIICGLMAWGILLGLGAYFAPSDPGKAGDFRKLWVVAGMVGAFLILWALALGLRARKVRQKRPKDDI